ncbi:MAG TPA: zinc ribbon domain-containing protein [Gemmatimonadales bacterium]|nr:zinc ribbon domain-containing protein [Gemmatimonadales bacterium]
MTDLERLFRRLVDNLIAIDPARLHRPLALGELVTSVIPYRTNRRSLSIDSAEDYDMLILRLCAGEGGFVRVVSEDIAQVFRDQLTSPNPDLDVLREHAKADLVLGTEPLAHALGPGPEEAYAPPDEEDLEPPPPSPSIEPVAEVPLESVRRVPFSAEPVAPPAPPPPRMTADPEPKPSPRLLRDSGQRCSFCGGRLPSGRAVNFCPHCGQNQSFTRCPECQSELELGWRHCITCGHAINDS